MRKILVASVTWCALLAGSYAMAQERVGDAAMGAVSGAVVLGPVGALAGAVVGYTSGPAIAHAWGLHRHKRPATPVKAAQAGRPAPAQTAPAQAAAPVPTPSAPPTRRAANPAGMAPAQSFE